jgi:hypothetical protein
MHSSSPPQYYKQTKYQYVVREVIAAAIMNSYISEMYRRGVWWKLTNASVEHTPLSSGLLSQACNEHEVDRKDNVMHSNIQVYYVLQTGVNFFSLVESLRRTELRFTAPFWMQKQSVLDAAGRWISAYYSTEDAILHLVIALHRQRKICSLILFQLSKDHIYGGDAWRI